MGDPNSNNNIDIIVDSSISGGLVGLDEEYLLNLAEEQEWSGEFAAWSQHSKVYAMVSKKVQQANQKLASFEQIKKFVILSEPLTEEKGLLTSTQKIKRGVVSTVFSEEWKGLYS